MEVFENPDIDRVDSEEYEQLVLGEEQTDDLGCNLIVVSNDYVLNSQGLVLSFYIVFDFCSIKELVELSNLFIKFIHDNHLQMLKDFDFESKYSSPIVYHLGDEKIRLVKCYVAEESQQLIDVLESKGVHRAEYL